jgi:SAM-dependent methyltransferase
MNEPAQDKRAWSWNQVSGGELEYWSKPSGEVVSFGSQLTKVGAKRVYDLGCGIGRHALYMAQHGFEVYASDTSADGLKETRRRLHAVGLRAEIVLSDLTALPYRSSFFDAAIAYNVVYHGVRAEVEACLSELHRVLRPGGLLFATFLSTRDGYLEKGPGRRVDENTVVKAGGPEDGIAHYFIDREELDRLTDGFEPLRISHKDEWLPELGKTTRSSHWALWAKKPGGQR